MLCRTFQSVQSLSHVQLLVTPWTAARQASLSITNSQSLRKLMSIELVMPSNYPILCCPLLLLPLIFPSIRVFSSESALRIRWPQYWSFSFSISPSQSCFIVPLHFLIEPHRLFFTSPNIQGSLLSQDLCKCSALLKESPETAWI